MGVSVKRGIALLVCLVMLFAMVLPANAADSSVFTDLDKGAWYYDDVAAVIEAGLMSGTSKTSFSPDMSLDRAMMVTVLWRLEGSPEGYSNTFSDVGSSAYYYKSVAWAAATGIVSGVGNNRFDPTAHLNREQMLTIFYRYASAKPEYQRAGASLSGYPDEAAVASYAKEGVAWGVAWELLHCPDGKLNPKVDATRAEVAVGLALFLDKPIQPEDGKSAYELAVENGFAGTLDEWLASLVGNDGQNGKSAYELAVENGYAGTLTQWLAALEGENGADGKDGTDGADGADGQDGKSAYELAVENGYLGSESEWLASLTGTDGSNGKSAYELAVENGFVGTLDEWLASLQGTDGENGSDGADGEDGADGKSAYELAVESGYTGTVQEWLASLAGDGKNGADGKSAYELAVLAGYVGTEIEWLRSLAGKDGKSAYEIAVANGYLGTEVQWLASLVGEAGADGKDGINGVDGEDGKDGAAGADGFSAYELAVENGYKGSLDDWLVSLIGPSGVAGRDGTNGTNGKDGKDGKDGADGKSAYELAVSLGYTEDLASWLDTLVGKDGVDGADGISAYELAVENGYVGTITQWLASLVGKDGTDGKSAYELAAQNGYSGTLQQWLESLAGTDGADGKSAYELAVENGYQGTESLWLASLVGAPGKSAYELAVDKGYTGTEAEWLESLRGGDGTDGSNGKSAYELAVDKGYTGTEAEWLASLAGTDGIDGTNGTNGTDGTNGTNGTDGTDGVGVQDAYVNDEMHLILVLTNGTEIDSGYVGTEVTPPTPTTYTVTFMDYNGAVLDTQQVTSGGSATPPAAPTREGYTFAGWQGSYTNVTSSVTITATYTQNTPPATGLPVTFVDYNGAVLDTQQVDRGGNATPPTDPTRGGYTFIGWQGAYTNIQAATTVTAVYVSEGTPAFVISHTTASPGATQVEVTISIKDNPGILGMTLTVAYDESVMTMTGAANGEAVSGVLTLTKAKTLSSGCNFVWDGQEITQEDIRDGAILKMKFTISGSAPRGAYPITVSYRNSDIVDADLMTVSPATGSGYIAVVQ